MPNADTSRVNLEHVLPITPSESWSKYWNSDDAQAYQRRLGNMAIMAAKMNSAIGNEEFAKKRIELKKSSFSFTKMIGDCTQWDKAAIEARQVAMAEVAARVWSIKG